MGTETWIISLPLSDSILYLKIIHPPNFREEPKNWTIERTEPIFYNRKTEYLFGENKFGAGNEKNVHMH